MSEVAIPPQSLERMRAVYSQFEQLCVVVAEAMALPAGSVTRVELGQGVFIVTDQAAPQNGKVIEHAG